MEYFVLLNHLFLSVDALTYQSIYTSDFLRNEFAVSESRTTVRPDYPDGYTGLYFYGHETYFEFFDAENSTFTLNSFGIASGYETKGKLQAVYKAMESKHDVRPYQVGREVNGNTLDWFTTLPAHHERFRDKLVLWAMEYNDSFISNWLGADNHLQGSILQRDVLTAYVIKLEQEEIKKSALMKDITAVDIMLEQQDLLVYSDIFVGFGWGLETVDECYLLSSQTTTISLCPTTADAQPGIHRIMFSLNRKYDGAEQKTFGSSILKFKEKTAEWIFQLPKPFIISNAD